MKYKPTNERELLQMLQSPETHIREAGWNTFFDWYQDDLYLDARRSLLKRGMTNNLADDTVTVVREMWLKIQDNIDQFEYRKERGLYNYARTYLAYECWTLRRSQERAMHKEAREISFEGAEHYGGEGALNALFAVINRFNLLGDTIEMPGEHVLHLQAIANLLTHRLKPAEVELLMSRMICGESYQSMANRLGISENYARQKVYRARQHFIAGYKLLVEKAYREGEIAYGTFRWLMSCAEPAA